MEERCKVAVIGAGYMAREHIRAFQELSSVDIVGIYSRTRSRAEELARDFNLCKVYDSIENLYRSTHADLVVVAVSELSVKEVCFSCFQHSWMVLIEKPAGYNVADAELIEATARAMNRRAYVALNRRHYGSTRTVLADLHNLKGPRLISITDQEDRVAALSMGQPQLVVENWMYANAIHLIDLFRVFGRGAITRVERTLPWAGGTSCYVAATIHFESGDAGLYEAVWDGPGPWAVSVNTSAKRWEMRPLEVASFQLAGQRTLQKATDDPQDIEFKPGLREQARRAVATAMGRASSVPTIQDALESMRLVQAIYD